MTWLHARWSGVGVCVATCLVACTWYNRLDRVCHRSPAASVVSLEGTGNQWLEGAAPAVQLGSSTVLVAYPVGDDPYNSTRARLAMATIDGRGSGTTQCPDPSGSLDPDALASEGTGAALPAVAYAKDVGVGAIAYRLTTRPVGTDEVLDSVRAAFVGSRGCPVSTDDGQTFFDVEASTLTRAISDTQVTYVREGKFVVSWLSRDRAVESFDDVLRFRLMQTGLPRLVPTPEYEPLKITLEDRWIRSPYLIALDVPDSRERRFALVWHARGASSGATKLKLIDEQLQPISAAITLDTDFDQGDAIAKKSVAGAYDSVRHVLFVAWTKVQEGVSTIVGRRIEVWPSLNPGARFEVTTPADGPAYAPTLTMLSGDNVFVAWRTPSGISGATFELSANRRYTSYGCGTRNFELFRTPDEASFNPLVLTSGYGLVLLFAVETRLKDDSHWRVRRSYVDLDDLLPGGE